MYRARISSDFFLADHFIKPGIYIVENVTAAAVLTLRAGDVEKYEFTKPVNYNGRVLIIRPGGFGDLLFLTPIIHSMVAAGKSVTVCTHPRYFDILKGQPCECVPYPILESDFHEFETIGIMENAVEDSKDDTHITDLFAERLGITLEDRAWAHCCRYVVTDEERAWALERFPKTLKPRIGIQVKASADCRTYPERALTIVSSVLVQKGCEVFLFGAPGSLQIEPSSPYVCLPAHGLDIRQSAAVLLTCDACIAPDSALTALAGALDIPTVGLYGPFPHQARTRYHPSIFAINGQAPCAPCFHHARTDPWVSGAPCSTAKMCIALAQITPQRIVSKIESMLLR